MEGKKKVLIGIKKAKTLLTTVEEMIEEDKYCLDIIQQSNAAIGLMRATNKKLLQNNLGTCAAHKLASRDKEVRDVFIKELMQTITNSNK